jgi:hypothetical protein
VLVELEVLKISTIQIQKLQPYIGYNSKMTVRRVLKERELPQNKHLGVTFYAREFLVGIGIKDSILIHGLCGFC